MAEIDYGKGIRGFLGKMPDIDYQYTPIPFQEQLGLAKLGMQKDMLDQERSDAKQQEILNLYKTIAETGKTVVPGLEDEMRSETDPYIKRIEEGIEATGGDLTKFNSSFDIMKDLYKDIYSGRLGSLTRSGKQYASALDQAQKLNESYLSGDGGVPMHISQYGLQAAANKSQQLYDEGNPATFSMPNLSEHVDVIPETRKHLTEMQAFGFTDPETGNKVEKLDLPTIMDAAVRFMSTDDKTKRSIMQEISLPLQAGAIDIPEVGSEEASKLLDDPRYAGVYSETVIGMGGAPNAEEAGIAAAFRASLIDKRVNEYATSASQVFLQHDEGDDTTGDEITDQYAIGQGSALPISYVEEDVANIKNNQLALDELIAERNAYNTDDPRYADVNRQVTNLESVIKAQKKAIPSMVEETLAGANKNINDKDIFEETTKDLNRSAKNIVRILSAVDESLYVPGAGSGTSSLIPVVGGSTTETTEKTAKVLRDIVEKYPEYGLDPKDITNKNANKIKASIIKLRKEYKQVVESKKYEQKMKTLVPGTIIIGGRDIITERAKTLTNALVNGDMQFVDISTGADINATLQDKSASFTSGFEGSGGVKITPTASFVNGKLAYKVTYTKKDWEKDEPREATLYVTQAGFDGQAQQNEVASLASNLNKSNLPANKQAAAELVADSTYGAPLQRSEIEYSFVDSKGELPGYEGEVAYVEKPVTGIDGISAIRKVQVGPGQYDYYILNANGEPYATEDQSQYITSRSVIDLGRFIQQQYGEKE